MSLSSQMGRSRSRFHRHTTSRGMERVSVTQSAISYSCSVISLNILANSLPVVVRDAEGRTALLPAGIVLDMSADDVSDFFAYVLHTPVSLL